MPAKTEKQRRYFAAELSRRRAGQPTETHMGARDMAKMASKGRHNTPGNGTGMDGVPEIDGRDILTGPRHTKGTGG